jgi:hypothetical protein
LPQLAGLEVSTTSMKYAIKTVGEAEASGSSCRRCSPDREHKNSPGTAGAVGSDVFGSVDDLELRPARRCRHHLAARLGVPPDTRSVLRLRHGWSDVAPARWTGTTVEVASRRRCEQRTRSPVGISLPRRADGPSGCSIRAHYVVLCRERRLDLIVRSSRKATSSIMRRFGEASESSTHRASASMQRKGGCRRRPSEWSSAHESLEIRQQTVAVRVVLCGSLAGDGVSDLRFGQNRPRLLAWEGPIAQNGCAPCAQSFKILSRSAFGPLSAPHKREPNVRLNN